MLYTFFHLLSFVYSRLDYCSLNSSSMDNIISASIIHTYVIVYNLWCVCRCFNDMFQLTSLFTLTSYHSETNRLSSSSKTLLFASHYSIVNSTPFLYYTRTSFVSKTAFDSSSSD